MTTGKPTPEDREETEKQLTEWLLERCDIENVPQLISLLELSRPKAITDRLKSAVTNHRRKHMIKGLASL